MSYTSHDFPHTHFYESDLRELIAMYQQLTSDYTNLVADMKAIKDWEAQHKEEYQELVNRVATVENEIATFESEINRRFSELETNINQEFASLTLEIRQELAQTVSEITNLFNTLKHEIEVELENMKAELRELEYYLQEMISNFRLEMADYIDERFELFIQNLPDYEHLIVHNPVRGEDTTVQVAIDDLYSAAFNVFGLTAYQFDSMELTCNEFEGYNLTAREFDTMGYKLLPYPDPTYYMVDPFTGEWVLVKDVVMKLFALHAGTMTVLEFEALDLTASEFDAKETTAFNFDFFGISA